MIYAFLVSQFSLKGIELLRDLDQVTAEKTMGNISAFEDDGYNAELNGTDEASEDNRPSAIAPDDLDEQYPVDEEAKALALAIAEAADDRKAGDITILETGNVSYLADYFVIVTGFSQVQVRAIANSIEDGIEADLNRQALRTEGMSEGRWVLKDYGDVIVHIFMPSDREFYDLEAFWGHATKIEFTPQNLSPAANGGQSGPSYNGQTSY